MNSSPEAMAIYAACGAAGGLARLLISGKGILILPCVSHGQDGRMQLDIGCLAPLVIGCVAGILSPSVLHINGIVSVISGYVGSDFIENAAEQLFTRKKQPPL